MAIDENNIPYTTYQTGLLHSRGYRSVWMFMSRVLAPYQLTMSSWGMLGTLSMREDFRLNELAAMLGVKPPVATMMVTDLADRGFVERRPYSDDARVTIVVLTQSGHEAVDEVEKSMRLKFHGFLNDIPSNDLLVYMRVLEKLANRL